MSERPLDQRPAAVPSPELRAVQAAGVKTATRNFRLGVLLPILLVVALVVVWAVLGTRDVSTANPDFNPEQTAKEHCHDAISAKLPSAETAEFIDTSTGRGEARPYSEWSWKFVGDVSYHGATEARAWTCDIYWNEASEKFIMALTLD
jgi:hypothetical protein